MYAAPPRVTADVVARLPDEMRNTDREAEWLRMHPQSPFVHSLLEGPCFDRHGTLHCVDVIGGRVFRVSESGIFSTVLTYDGEPNGLKFHRDGRLFVADFKNGIMVLDPQDGIIRPFLDRIRLERLKAVNDLTFDSAGNLYFTDQGMTGHQDPSGRVFRVSAADGHIDCLLDNVPSPNGLVLDLSETVLYVAATRANAVWRVPMMPDGSVAKVGTFIQLSGGTGPDGLAMDEAGCLYVAHVGLGAVWCFDPYGEPLTRIQAPEGRHTTNLAFGGKAKKTLFITEAQSGTILATETESPGCRLFSEM